MLIPWASQQRGGSPAPLIPIALSDFENGVYQLNGAAKTYADLWNAPGGHLVLTGGVGLIQDYHGASSASGTATGTDTLINALQPQLGYGGVIDVTPTWDNAQQANPSFYASGGIFVNHVPQSPPYPHLDGAFEVIPGSEHGDAYSHIGQINTADDSLLNGASNRIAFLATPTILAVSINGGAVFSMVNNGDYSTLSFMGITVYQSAGSGFNSIFKKISLYAPFDPALLPGLST